MEENITQTTPRRVIKRTPVEKKEEPSKPEDTVLTTKSSKTSQEALLDYVDEKIRDFERYTKLSNTSGFLDFYTLNDALSHYSGINASLITLDVMAKCELDTAQNEFDEWMADKYMTARNILNPPTLTASKWCSSKEIEYYIINNYYSEYSRLKENLQSAEKKVAFCRRMLEGWERQLYVIRTICRNTEVETIRLGGSLGEG